MVKEVNLNPVLLTVDEVYRWWKKPAMRIEVDDRGNAQNAVPKEPLADFITCRLRVLLHCFSHPSDMVSRAALPHDDKIAIEEIFAREAENKKKSRRRRKK